MKTDPTTVSEKTLAIAERIHRAEGPVSAQELRSEFGHCSTYIETLLRRGEIVRLSRGRYTAA